MNVLLPKFTRGFTIVELIVIIVVIGILASIAVVSYTGFQNKANKSSLDSTGQQVKLKLGEHFTDKNNYPQTKADVVTYLNSIGSNSLATSFNNTYNSTSISYVACRAGTSPCTAAAASSSPCDNATSSTTPCATYQITIPYAAWKGTSGDIVITP